MPTSGCTWCWNEAKGRTDDHDPDSWCPAHVERSLIEEALHHAESVVSGFKASLAAPLGSQESARHVEVGRFAIVDLQAALAGVRAPRTSQVLKVAGEILEQIEQLRQVVEHGAEARHGQQA